MLRTAILTIGGDVERGSGTIIPTLSSHSAGNVITRDIAQNQYQER
jgi:hypothetical protein